MSWNQTYLLAAPDFIPTQGDVDRLVGYLIERGIVGDVTDGAPVLGNSVTWAPGPNATEATLGRAWEVSLIASVEPEPYADESGVIAETHLVLIFYEAADAQDEFVAEVSRLLGVRIMDGISHH